MNPTVDDDLIGILKNSSLSIDARLQGWSYVIGLSGTDDGIKHLIKSNKYVPFLSSFITKENREELTKLAFKSLINISTVHEGMLSIISSRKDICNYLLSSICDPDPKLVEYKCYLLANMSTNTKVVEQIVDILLSSKGLYQMLVKVYCSSEEKVWNQFDFLTLVFANISRTTEGRRLFLQDSDFLTSILKFLKASESESRRLGTALILRNCCLETEYHEKLLHKIGILPALLLPLMVPQKYEEGGEMGQLSPELQQQCLDEVQERDKSLSVRKVLIEALTILCYSESSWQYLKSNGTYCVVRDLHAWETDVDSKDMIEQLVTYFLVVDYSKPVITESYLDCDAELIKQLELDMTKDLPDFVVKGKNEDA